jgi:pimeloyl-ACP methyl ester carboxylesterase
MRAPTLPEPNFVRTNGIRMAVYEAGRGLPVVLCHGWPELAYSWRHQIPALAAAGYRAIAPDQRGYGQTDRPEKVEDYDMTHLTDDLVGLLDALDLEKAVFCGHDWGGLVVWQLPLLHPDRVAGVVGINTPFLPRPPVDPVALMRQAYGENMYIVYFQKYGAADALLARDVGRVFRRFMRKNVITNAEYAKLPPQERRLEFLGAFEGPEPERQAGDLLLDHEELAVFVETYERTGFTGGINWYRNLTRNWQASEGLEQRVRVPALMISAEDDFVLSPAMTDGMEAYVPDLEKHVIPACGHWTQQEKPDELNRLLIDWLKRRFPS